MSVWIVLSLWYLMQRTVQDNSSQLMRSKPWTQSIPAVFFIKFTEHLFVRVKGKGLVCVPQLEKVRGPFAGICPFFRS